MATVRLIFVKEMRKEEGEGTEQKEVWKFTGCRDQKEKREGAEKECG